MPNCLPPWSWTTRAPIPGSRARSVSRLWSWRILPLDWWTRLWPLIPLWTWLGSRFWSWLRTWFWTWSSIPARTWLWSWWFWWSFIPLPGPAKCHNGSWISLNQQLRCFLSHRSWQHQVGVVNNITRATVFLLTLIKYLHQYSKTTAYCVPKPLL